MAPLHVVIAAFALIILGKYVLDELKKRTILTKTNELAAWEQELRELENVKGASNEDASRIEFMKIELKCKIAKNKNHISMLVIGKPYQAEVEDEEQCTESTQQQPSDSQVILCKEAVKLTSLFEDSTTEIVRPQSGYKKEK